MLEKILEETMQKAETVFGRRFARPSIVYNKRLTATAGRAFLEENKIDISFKIAQREGRQMLVDTIVHEVAHLLAWEMYQCRTHGSAWKHVMAQLGHAPEVYHDYKTDRKEFTYDVSGNKVTLGPIQHKRCQAGKVYVCKFGKITKENYVL